MLILSKNHLADNGLKLVQKSNGDCMITPVSSDNSAHHDIMEMMEDKFSQVPHDIRATMVSEMIMKLNLQQLIVTLAATPDHRRQEAHVARSITGEDSY